MAGIGFTLKKLFREESFSSKGKAYLYSAIVAAGPWIAAVITVNSILFVVELSEYNPQEKDVFLGTIVYSFIFSQIITSPWQMIITRYISDRLYMKEYKYIRPSFIGLNKIVFFLSFLIAVLFYIFKPLPLAYKIMSVYLFVVLSMIWVIMTYLSAVKNYELIAKAYIYGGIISIALAIYLMNYPIKFIELSYTSNILFSYLIGLSITYIVLIYDFLSTFYYGNNLQYDFLRYLNRFPSLFWIGLFYTLGLWADDILMWLSTIGVEVYKTYLYAPIYDNAVFLAYLTTIPTSVLFLVSIETEFYDSYKKYFGLVNNFGNYQEITLASEELKEVLYRKLLYTFQIQSLISISTVMLSTSIFKYLNLNILIRDIFKVCAFGALFNVIILIIILTLLYFESRIRALLVSILFFISNIILTYYFANKGLKYYGYGFTLGAFITLIFAIINIVRLLNGIKYRTFAIQPLFVEEERGMFVKIANFLNNRTKGRIHRSDNKKEKLTISQ